MSEDEKLELEKKKREIEKLDLEIEEKNISLLDKCRAIESRQEPTYIEAVPTIEPRESPHVSALIEMNRKELITRSPHIDTLKTVLLLRNMGLLTNKLADKELANLLELISDDAINRIRLLPVINLIWFYVGLCGGVRPCIVVFDADYCKRVNTTIQCPHTTSLCAYQVNTWIGSIHSERETKGEYSVAALLHYTQHQKSTPICRWVCMRNMKSKRNKAEI